MFRAAKELGHKTVRLSGSEEQTKTLAAFAGRHVPAAVLSGCVLMGASCMDASRASGLVAVLAGDLSNPLDQSPSRPHKH